MCSRYLRKREPVACLKTMCVDLLIKNIELYEDSLLYLPDNVKIRILLRLNTVPVKFKHIDYLYKCLLHEKVDRLNLSRIECLNDDFLEMISICKNLRSLTLPRQDDDSFSPKGLISILPNFKLLATFVAPTCSAITDEVTATLVKNCKYLTGIDYSGCENITDKSMEEIAKLDWLVALKLTNTKVTTKGLIQVSTGNSKNRLRELYIDKCNNITNDAVYSICENCTAMEVLIFNNCSQIDGQSCINMESNTWKNLKQLSWTVY